MEINFKGEGAEGKEFIILTDDNLNNPHYVDLIVGCHDVTVNIKDLYLAIKAFKEKHEKEWVC